MKAQIVRALLGAALATLVVAAPAAHAELPTQSAENPLINAYLAQGDGETRLTMGSYCLTRASDRVGLCADVAFKRGVQPGPDIVLKAPGAAVLRFDEPLTSVAAYIVKGSRSISAPVTPIDGKRWSVDLAAAVGDGGELSISGTGGPTGTYLRWDSVYMATLVSAPRASFALPYGKGALHASPDAFTTFDLPSRFTAFQSVNGNWMHGSYVANVSTQGRTCHVLLSAFGQAQRSRPSVSGAASSWGGSTFRAGAQGRTGALRWYEGVTSGQHVAFAWRVAPAWLASPSRRFVVFKMSLGDAYGAAASCASDISSQTSALRQAIRSARVVRSG